VVLCTGSELLRLDHAREVIGDWRDDYLSIKPHNELGRLQSDEFRVRETKFFQKQVAG
jgi:putative transposase